MTGRTAAGFHRALAVHEDHRAQHEQRGTKNKRNGVHVSDSNDAVPPLFQQAFVPVATTRREIETRDRQTLPNLSRSTDYDPHFVAGEQTGFRYPEVQYGFGPVIGPIVHSVEAHYGRHEHHVKYEWHENHVINVVTAEFNRFWIKNLVDSETFRQKRVEHVFFSQVTVHFSPDS